MWKSFAFLQYLNGAEFEAVRQRNSGFLPRLLVFEVVRSFRGSLVFCRERACSFRENQRQGYCFSHVENRQTVIENTYYPRSAIIQGLRTEQSTQMLRILCVPTKYHRESTNTKSRTTQKAPSFRNLSSNEVRYKFREREKFGYSPHRA